MLRKLKSVKQLKDIKQENNMCVLCWEMSGTCQPLNCCPQLRIYSSSIQQNALAYLQRRVFELEEELKSIKQNDNA